ncbi:MAG: M48 family metallopeptidase [Pseudobacter sp.]|uniref:M48 family metallopeptidase n=1 Tax=Pseudobacter sp. TaxID=2045420 RepID=UPI003F7EC0B0
MRLLFLLAIIFLCQQSWSQTIAYKPLADDASQLKSWDETLASEHKRLISNLPSTYKPAFKKIYEERYEGLKELTAKNRILTDSLANNYLQQMAQLIFQSNPGIPDQGYRIRFTRDDWPNAASMGEGTIIFNIGLFTKLQNESQVAFVLCHEIAHYHLKHSQRSIEHYVNTTNSDEFRAEVKKIMKSQYQQGKQAEALLKGVAFNSRRHTRENESAADSMALELLKNTPFKTEEALTCLALLDSVDTDKYNVAPPLETVFNFPQYPFQKKWVQEEQSLFNAMAASTKEEKKKERDSLKTHPDCDVRVKQLQAKVQQYSTGNKQANPLHEARFKQLQEIFDYEIIEHCYNKDEVSKSFYYTLQMLHYKPQDPYLVANTGRCLNKLYQSQKDHLLNRIVDLPSPWNEQKYNKLLQFIQKVRLNDFAAFSYYFLLPYQSANVPSEEMLVALINSKDNFNKPEEKSSLIALYNKHYPNGKLNADNNPQKK